jgi:hypothetical protein
VRTLSAWHCPAIVGQTISLKVAAAAVHALGKDLKLVLTLAHHPTSTCFLHCCRPVASSAGVPGLGTLPRGGTLALLQQCLVHPAGVVPAEHQPTGSAGCRATPGIAVLPRRTQYGAMWAATTTLCLLQHQRHKNRYVSRDRDAGCAPIGYSRLQAAADCCHRVCHGKQQHHEPHGLHGVVQQCFIMTSTNAL